MSEHSESTAKAKQRVDEKTRSKKSTRPKVQVIKKKDISVKVPDEAFQIEVKLPSSRVTPNGTYSEPLFLKSG